MLLTIPLHQFFDRGLELYHTTCGMQTFTNNQVYFRIAAPTCI
jgi:hypothetical protein